MMNNVRKFLLASACLAAAFIANDLGAAAGDLYSGGLSARIIKKFTPAGASSTFITGPFADALAFDTQGNLFVGDTQSDSIIKVTRTGTQTTFATGVRTTGLAFDSAGNLYATDTHTNSIFKYTPAGSKTTFATGLSGPFGLAFDRAGNLFVSQTNNNIISKITPGGTKTTFASSLNVPEGLAFDSSGNLYVANFNNGKITKITAGGTKSAFTTSLSAPRHLTLDQSNNLYVADFPTQKIFKFTPAAVKSTFASSTNAGGLAFEPASGHLTSISTRASVQTGAGVTIAGFIVTGTDSKTVIVRGLGPTLSQPPFNVSNVLADPTLDLHDSTSSIATNDDWQTAANANQIPTSPVDYRPPNSLESAILKTLQPGAYTAIMSGSGKNPSPTGNGLVEVYDLATSTFSQLTSVSTRGFVGTGDNVMIGGIITSGGNGSTQIVIRGLGPTLGQPPFNVPNVLADPYLELRDVNGNLLEANNDWKDPDQVAIQATGLAPPNNLESAIVVTVGTGNYTAILKGNNGGTGIGLVEVYKIR
jgi:sugar lactone lactonase YvrE